MAHDAPQATGPSKLVIRNIGLLLSGALEKPILDADTSVAENGKISAIGRAKDVDTAGATTNLQLGVNGAYRVTVRGSILFGANVIRLGSASSDSPIAETRLQAVVYAGYAISF